MKASYCTFVYEGRQVFLSSHPLLFLLGREAFTSSEAFVKWSMCATLRLLIDIGPGCLVFVAIVIVGVLGVLYVFWVSVTYQIYDFQIFSPISWVVFHSIDCVL